MLRVSSFGGYLGLLLEKPERDIAPYIPAEIDEDRVHTLCGVKKSSHIVVMLNLRRALEALQTEGEGELVREGDLNRGHRSDVTQTFLLRNSIYLTQSRSGKATL